MSLHANTAEETRVIFRKWNKRDGGDVIALFPDIKAHNPGMVLRYQHIGQHGAADYIWVVSVTKPATPDEYKALKRELESAPFHYNLKVSKRQ